MAGAGVLGLCGRLRRCGDGSVGWLGVGVESVCIRGSLDYWVGGMA